MKILVVNWQDRLNPQAGGAEIHLHEVFGRLAGWGHEVTLLVSAFGGARPREEVDGMRVHRTGGRYSFGLAGPRYFRRTLAREPFEVVVEDLNKVPLFLPLYTRVPVVPLVHHLFGSTAFAEAPFPLALATWLLERPIPWVYRRLPLVTVSRSTAEDLHRRGLREGPVTIVPNGVDLERYLPDPVGRRFPEPTLLYLGRLQRYKRVDLILQAVAILRREGLPCRLVVAGKGGQARALRELRSRLGLDECVELVGFVEEDEKTHLLQKSWVHVLTSAKEGWGIANLEAAACGTPTVASDSPGLRDSVLHGETGLLVPHGDVRALAEALGRMLRDTALLRRMGAAARVFAEGFTWEASARSMEELLVRRVASGRGGR